jgi:hypothetical protein
MERLQRIEGLRVALPDGAFYVLPDVSAYFGAGVEAQGFGPVPDADTLCRRATPITLSGACRLPSATPAKLPQQQTRVPWVA